MQGAEVTLREIGETTDNGYVEIRGLSAGAFSPDLWQAGALNWVPDVRSPMIEPLPGEFRNIYAPSAVQTEDGWRVFYGAWDGVPTGNDRIYSVTTRDFLTFDERYTVIEHGPFIHVCNVNALRLPDASWAMVCTAYPAANGRNKPAFFSSPDGTTWNGSPAPYVASMDDIVAIGGYDTYEDADINGMNVILHEEGLFRLYFGDFKNFGKVYRASGRDGRRYEFEGPALDGSYAVNDVKKFRVGDGWWYLMGLHMNRDTLWYSLSRDGRHFPPVQVLGKNLSDADRYIVAVGWVVDGGQEREGRRLLGVLYGAGHHPGLASNRVFARWLQKRVVVTGAGGEMVEGAAARGPDRQRLALGERESVTGALRVYAEDGRSLIGELGQVTLSSGSVYQLVFPAEAGNPYPTAE